MVSPTVSVVIPTRNRPRLLRAALATVRAQRYPARIETLVVHDRSAPDQTLARDDPHRPVRVLSNQRTTGLAGARNTGILAASGELVGFCDDDDYWLPDKLTAQVAALASRPGAELVSCGIRVNYAGRQVTRSLPWAKVPLAALLRSRLTELHPSTFLMRRDAVLDGIGLVDEEIPGSYAEDYEFLLRAARRRDVANVTDPHVVVRWHQQSYFAQRWQTIAGALQWLLERYPEFASQPRGAARVCGQIAFASAAAGDRRVAAQWAARSLRHHPAELRGWLALAVAAGVVGAGTVARAAHRRGRGV